MPRGNDDGREEVPPDRVQAEQCFLASIMLDRRGFAETRQLVRASDFLLERHAVIYEVICRLYEAVNAADAVLVREELLKRGRLREAGGTVYLGGLLSAVPSGAHAPEYAKIVRRHGKGG